jgi:hypothetical protein
VITLFTLPKPFLGHIGMIQRNALQSWTRLHPDIDILIFGDEPGTAEAAAEFGIRHFPDVDVNEYGTPLISRYFRHAEEVARQSRMCYVNADIVLFPDLLEAVAKVDLPKFLMSGRRTDYDIDKPVDFLRPDWAHALREDAKKNGRLHDFSAIDYFVYRRGMFGEIPQFALGRWYWDQWLVYRARRLGGALIDASACVMAVHQNHDYRHIVDTESKGDSRNQGGIESFRNRLLVESILMTLEDADWQVDGSGLSRVFRRTRWHLVNEAALQAEIRGLPEVIRRPLVWIARQQWDRNWKRRYADLLSERTDLIAQSGRAAARG